MCSDNFLCEEYICMHQTNGHKKEHKLSQMNFESMQKYLVLLSSHVNQINNIE